MKIDLVVTDVRSSPLSLSRCRQYHTSQMSSFVLFVFYSLPNANRYLGNKHTRFPRHYTLRTLSLNIIHCSYCFTPILTLYWIIVKLLIVAPSSCIVSQLLIYLTFISIETGHLFTLGLLFYSLFLMPCILHNLHFVTKSKAISMVLIYFLIYSKVYNLYL